MTSSLLLLAIKLITESFVVSFIYIRVRTFKCVYVSVNYKLFSSRRFDHDNSILLDVVRVIQ